jgi:thiamine-monophosphate kinase
LNEFDIIRRYFTPPTDHTILAGGDDAALVAVTPGMDLAVSTDALVAGNHFFEDAEARSVGHKALAVNLSDMAAMGARPRWATLALTLPEADESWLGGFAEGLLALAKDHGVDLVGGDTTRGPLNICVHILGEVEQGKALRRSGACVGDDLWVSGSIGGAALALAHLRGQFELRAQDRDWALRRLNYPNPRVAVGCGLIGLATSCIDISDGLVADVGHLTERSGVRISIEWELVPLPSAAVRHRDHPLVRRAALAGGDDYELAFTAPAGLSTEMGALAARAGVALTRVGRVDQGSGVAVVDGAGRTIVLTETGFDHFR